MSLYSPDVHRGDLVSFSDMSKFQHKASINITSPLIPLLEKEREVKVS